MESTIGDITHFDCIGYVIQDEGQRVTGRGPQSGPAESIRSDADRIRDDQEICGAGRSLGSYCRRSEHGRSDCRHVTRQCERVRFRGRLAVGKVGY